jgi:hypothetical protein
VSAHLLERCVAALRSSGVEATVDDGLLRVGSARWPVRAQPEGVKLAAVPGLAASLDGHVLVVPHVPPETGRALRAAGVPHVDASANAWLTGRGLLVLVEGRPPAEDLRRATPPIRGGGIQLLGVLLSDPSAARLSYRALAERAGVSLGTVAHALTTMKAEGALDIGAGGAFVFRDRRGLVGRYDQGWAAYLRPSLLLGRARPMGNLSLAAVADATTRLDGALVGGVWAAHRLLHDDTGEGALTLHTPAAWTETLRALRLSPDPAGPVHVVRRSHPGEVGTRDDDGHPCAHRSLVRAEVLAVGGPASAALARALG